MDELLTVHQAAKLMQLGRDTTYRLVSTGSIPSIRLGNQIRIPRGALLAHLEREAGKQVIESAPSNETTQ